MRWWNNKPYLLPTELRKWHTWWAWRPIRISETEWRYFEKMERKGEVFCGSSGCSHIWRYRAITRNRLPRGGVGDG